jgi:hypothetical protein
MDNRSGCRAIKTPKVHLKSALGVGGGRAVALRRARRIINILRALQIRALASDPYRDRARDESVLK